MCTFTVPVVVLNLIDCREVNACFVCIMFRLCVVFIPAVMMSRRSHQTLLHICMMKRPWKASGYHRKLGLPEKF